MTLVFRLTVCVLGLTLLSSQASAQALPWEGTGFVNVNLGLQLSPASLATTDGTFTIYGKPGTLATAQTIDTGASYIDFGAGVRVSGNFGLGFSYSRSSTDGSALVNAEVPSPVVKGQPRKATSTLAELEHIEKSLHFQAIWMLPVTDKFDVVLSGGPTWFHLSQGVVTTPMIWEVGPPYTTVNMTTSMVTVSDSQIGFNVGADLTYRFANNFGVGAMVRYARATAGLTLDDGSALDVKVGGFQIGGGLRIRF
jgi:hypothetical protein